MFISPYFGGCKYTNYFLFINKNIEFQHLGLLITSSFPVRSADTGPLRSLCILKATPSEDNPQTCRLLRKVFVYLGIAKRNGQITLKTATMDTGQKWVVVRIDGKIAAVSKDYRMLARISALLSSEGKAQKKAGKGGTAWEKNELFREIKAETVGLEEVWKLRNTCSWEDLMLFGTDFQKKVWRQLWELTHPAEGSTETERRRQRLISYSDFADLCQNRAGVRAVAHAIGLNPISVVIPCHLVIPKESIDRIVEIKKKAEATIFKGEDLCLATIIKDTSIDFGEYSLGRSLKRELIGMEVL